MYYEEKMINGIMHWRGRKDGEFQPYTLEELSRRYENLSEELKEVKANLLYHYHDKTTTKEEVK